MKVQTTHPTKETVKRVVVKPATETEAGRDRRFRTQAAANGVRLVNNGDGTFTVPSQTRNLDGTPRKPYVVQAVEHIGWCCTCRINEIHPSFRCAHIVRVTDYLKRAAQDEGRTAGLELAYGRACAGQPATVEDRRALAAAGGDLFDDGRVG